MSYTPPLEAEETGFKTTTPVLAGLTFNSTGSWDGAVDGYSQVQTEIVADQDGTIAVNFCSDAAFTDVVRSLSIPYTAANGYQFFAAPAFANFIEYKFTNTSVTNQTDFYYTTKILTTPISPQLLTTDAFIAPAMVTELGRSIQVGTDPNGTFTNAPQGGIDNGNSTTTTLSGSEVYNGTFSDTQGYSSTAIFIKADQDSLTNGLQIVHSSDGVTDERVISLTYITADNPQGIIYLIPASTKYFRLKYTNGAVTQTSFVTNIKYETSPQQIPTLPIGLAISNNTLANVNKSVIVGRNDAGIFNNVATDNQNHLKVDAANNRITYDEFPTSELTAISQLTFPYNINSDLTVTESLGTGIVSQSNDMAIVGTSAGTTSTEFAAIESVKTITYRAGEGAILRCSAKFTDFAPNGATSVQGFGLGDANDGYGYMMIGASSEVNVAYRTNGVQTTFSQSQWNADTMDGSGNLGNPSGMDLDPTKGNIYQVSYGSGFGCAYFSIESQSTGHMVLVHTLHISNLRTTPSTYNPTFALRAESFKDGSGPDTNDYVVSVADMASFTQGKDKITGTLHAYDNSKSIGGTETNVFTIQNKATVFGGAAGNNKVSSIIETISMYNDTNGAAVIRLWEDATLGGTPSYTDIDANTSVNSVDIAGTTRTGGKLIWVGGVAQTGGSNTNVVDLKIAMRPGKTYTFTAQSEGGANPISVGVVWVEDF